MRETALVHELGHALADQNYSIQKFLGKDSDNSEESAAREAVVEGQASWLMIEYAARAAGTSLADPDTASEYLKTDPDAGDDDKEYPVFSKAPLYLKRTLMFPYDEGQKFQQAVFLKDGRNAFAEVFRKPPASTSQVIHPDRYFKDVTFKDPDLPKPVAHAKTLVEGNMGELDHRILLTQFIGADEAEELGPKVRGSAYRIDEAKKVGATMLIYASDWEDEAAAAKFFADYRKVLRTKWKKIETAQAEADRFAGKSEDGYFASTSATIR